MSLRHTVQSATRAISRIPKVYLVIGLVVLVAVLYGVVFRERALAYSYAEPVCDRQLVILPDLMQMKSDGYELRASGGVAIGKYPLWATKVCATPIKAPQPGEVVASLSPFGGPIAKLRYKIEVPALPQADASVLKKPIAASRPLSVALSEVDKTFGYQVKSPDAAADCEASDKGLSCDIPKLQLKQGEQYELSLERQFKGKSVDTVAQAKIATLSPVTVTDASIAAGATIYDKPREVVITADKPLASAKFVLQKTGDAPENISVKSRIENNQAVVSWPNDLPRERNYTLTAETFEARDGSTPLDTYTLNFTTSGGPKVSNVSVGTAGVDLGARIAITMDQELKPEQDIGKLVTVDGASATVSHKGGQIFVQLSDTPKCQDFTIKISKDILSTHDIPAGSDWSRSQRTVCHTTSVVGYSKQGRAITAYEFGNGNRAVLFVGAIHGNERSTYSLMSRWIQELEAKAKDIPGDKKIVVVPQINPDGVVRGSRVSAGNVDLNRNFATADWKKDITTVGNQPFAGGGGDSPMSEPEAKAMAALAGRLRPELTLSYHSIGSLLAANQAGRSNELARTYSGLSGYRNTTGQASTTFEYAISGTWDDYLGEKLGLASILIELGSHSYHQFERNQAAMWAMVKS